MKKLLSTGILLTMIASPGGAAEMQIRDNPSPPPVNRPIDYAYDQPQDGSDPFFTFWDIAVYRPIGLAATIAGTGIFLGVAPMTILASIPEPHDAFVKTYKILIRTPARYTFVRPVGDKSLSPYSAFYDSPDAKRETRYDYDLLPAIGVPLEAPPAAKAETLRKLQSQPSEAVPK